MKKYLLFSLIFFSLQVSAHVEHLVDITNDESPNTFTLSVKLDDRGDIESLIRMTHSSSQEALETKTFFVGEFERKGEIVFDREGRFEVVLLRSYNFSIHNGGHLEVDILYNGVTGRRKSYEIELLRQGDQWIVQYKGKKVERMHFKSHRVLVLGTIGVKKINFN